MAIYYWAWSPPSSLINIPSKTPLKKTYFSSVSKFNWRGFLFKGGRMCPHPTSPSGLELCMFCAGCHSLWAHICDCKAMFPWCLPSTLAFTIFLPFFCIVPWALTQGIWKNHTLWDWVFQNLLVSAGYPVVGLCVHFIVMNTQIKNIIQLDLG